MAVTVMMFLSTVLILTLEVGLCQICDNAHAVDPSIYLEESFESLHTGNTSLQLLKVHLEDIYTAGNNGIFHLSKNLEIKSKHLTDEEENIFKILDVSESLEKLVTCSSGGNRGCQLRNLDDVSVNSSSSNTMFHKNVVASGEFRTFGLIASGKAGEGSSLYVASSIDLKEGGRRDRPIFERKLMGSGNDDRQTNVMSASVKASFVIYYSDVFSYGGFVYFLASQRDDATREDPSSPIVSKLSRICQNDESEELAAFAELQLACEGEDGSHYNITQSAQRNGNELFVVFNKNGEEFYEYDPQPQSALCVYNMTEIEGKFEENSYACACNDGGSENNSNNVYLSRAACGLLFAGNSGLSGCDGLRNIREDTFSCAGNVGSRNFFSYPEEPQGQAMSAAALYENSDLTFSSLSVTSVPRDESQRVAFIGTKEGKLLKVYLGKDTCSNYEVIHIGSQILGDTTLYNNNESLLVLTKSKLLKLKVANCSQFTTCYECIRPGSPLGDPYCGWCTLEKRCTRYDDCPSNNDISRWLPYNEVHCSTIAEVTPKSLPRDNHSRKLHLKITNLPELKTGEGYECHFNDWITTATVAADVINCTSPPLNEIPVVATGDYVTMQLQIFSSETGKTFLTKDYEFYDCRRIESCSDCVNSRWKCHWCILKHMCTYDSSSCDKVIFGAHVSSSNSSSDFCPQIIPGEKILIPSDVHQVLSFQAKHLPLLSNGNGVDYECSLISEDECCDDVDFVTHATLTAVDDITFTVTCTSRVYSYMKLQQTLDAKLRLKWNTGNAVDNFQPVKLYKCEVDRPDCSRCLSPATTAANLNCVWCRPSRLCTVGDKCEDQILPGRGVCPAPHIDKVFPSSSSLGGGTHVTVTGRDLGQTFLDITSVTLAGEECILLEDNYRVGESITCVAGPTDRVTDGGVVTVQILQQSGSKPDSFSYKDPLIGEFSPQRGPQSGGTLLEIIGEDLDTGGFVDVFIGPVQCISLSSRKAKSITCKTMAAEILFASTINVTFDKTDSKFSGNEFSFEEDPTVESVEPHRSIVSGGINLTVTGTNFDLIQRSQIIATLEGREISSRDCWMQKSTKLQCPSPRVNILPSRRRRQTESVTVREDVVIGFILDGVTSLQNWTADNDIDFPYFEDPKYFSFENNETIFTPDSQEIIQIQGENLDVASRSEDVTVYIGIDECIITVFDEKQIFCEPPKEQPEAGDVYGNRNQRGLPFVVVHHGINLRFDIGYVRYPRDPVVFIIIATCVAVILFLTIVILIFRYATRYKKKQVDKLLLELDYVKTNVSKELKIFYDTLQTALDKFEASRETMEQLKMTDRNQYVTKLLFISTSMELNDLTEAQRVTGLTEGMATFSELISMENFLTGLIRVIDDDSQLSDEQRSKISSLILLCLLLEGNIGHLAHVLKILMSEKIEKADHSLYYQLFRGNSTIFDRLLLNLMALCLYDTLSIEITDKILQLFTATKCIIETGPVDAVTGRTQFSLSFSHMLETQIEFKELKLNVLFRDECDRVVVLSFLNVDSIAQVKNKILDYFYQGRYSQLQHTQEQFDLVLCEREDEDRILTDDGILQLSNGWRKINTLSDYEVKGGDCVKLVKKLNNIQMDNKISEVKHYSYADVDESWSRNNQHLEAAEGTTSPDEAYTIADEGYLVPDVNQALTEGDNYDSLSKPATTYYYPDDNPSRQYQRKIPPRDVDSVYDEPEGGFGLWVWHLMKDDKRTRGRKTEDKIDESNLEDIVRPYLPATGSVLQKYVTNVFDAFMNPTGSHVSCFVKDIFDFFDRKATEQMAPELSNKWKSNVLFLKIYSTILTKPTIICDVKEYSYVQASLTVIDQTLREICTNKVVDRDDLGGQLFSQLVPVYRKKLDSYFKQITKMKSIDTETLENEYSRVEKAFTGTYDLLSAQHQLYTMLQRHIDQVCEKSQADTELVRKVRHMQTTLKKTTK